MGQRDNFDDFNEHEIRQRVQQRINERVEVYIHAVVFVAGNLGMWLLWWIINDKNIPMIFPAIATLGWGIGFVAHIAKVYFSTTMDRVRDREIDEAIERERARRAVYSGKRKNEDAPKMRLSEEGELVPMEDSDEPDLPPRRRSKTR